MRDQSDERERRITDGGRALLAYIRKHYAKGGVPRFCEEHHLDRIQVQRVLNGERWQRIPVDFALAIDRATAEHPRDRVRPAQWASKTATSADRAA